MTTTTTASVPTREEAEAAERAAAGPALEAALAALDVRALPAFGPAALPGLCRQAARSARAAAVLAELAPGVPFVGEAVLASNVPDAILACVRAGGVAREQLALPPGLHKHGGRERALALVLAALGAPYAPEMLRLVDQTNGLTHDTLVSRLDALYRGRLAPELLPVLARVITCEHTSAAARAQAMWSAHACGGAAAPLLEELLVAVQAEDREVQRAAASVLAAIEPPAAHALPILQPILEQRLPQLETRSGVRDSSLALVTAIAAVQPPPRHLAPPLEAVLRRLLAQPGYEYDAQVVGAALARIASERVLALLDEPDLPARARDALAALLLASRHVPTAIRVPWIVRALETGRGGLREARELAEASVFPPELVAPLVRLATSSSEVTRVGELLARHDRPRVLRELAPALAAERADVRARALQLVMELGEGELVVRFLVDPEPSIVRRAVRWLAFHGGAHLVAHLDREARCAG